MFGLLYWSLWCTGQVIFYSAIQCKCLDYYIGPYGVQGMLILICFIPPYSVNGWNRILVPMMYRAC